MGPIAYFSMEVAFDARMPTYAGGLGVLAGDMLRSAADLGVPMVAVTLVHRKGYFRQRLDRSGRQSEEPAEWQVDAFLAEQPARASVTVEGRAVQLRCWKYEVRGFGGSVPVFFLDADLAENAAADRRLTDVLYGGEPGYRLAQEVILGIGGVRMLRALGFQRIERFHMNEGHSSLLVMELIWEQARAAARAAPAPEDIAAVREKCIFTTHTPVAAGHDQYPLELARRVLGASPLFSLLDQCCAQGLVNLTLVALNFSRYVNGVAMRHGEVSRQIFGGYSIDAITNGVHAATWTSEPFQALFDRHIGGWRRDNFSLRYALGIPDSEIWEAHAAAKRALIERVKTAAGVQLDANALSLGFARRATAYKRADLLVHDVPRLKSLAAEQGALQVVYAGKAHPRDPGGKALIEQVVAASAVLADKVPLVYLEEHDLELARLLVAGVDVWLNTPLAPLEASGTSGMKAALNGVPSLSVLDGWWIEGHIEAVTGWSIGDSAAAALPDRTAADAASLYDKLERAVMPLYHREREGFIAVMRHAIALNGSFFNSHRALEEYVLKAYSP